MGDLIVIDGSQGEGGGQILRTALALSLVTGRPFRIERIRAGRPKPGLLRQHLTAVQGAAAIGQARIAGADLGSAALTFEPSTVQAGEYRFAVGTAGSATLVLQTVLPALLAANASSRLTLEGGTHNPAAPPFDFLARTFLSLVRRMGADVDVTLEAYGFYPAGGGRFVATIGPCPRLAPIALLDRGPVEVRARALVAGLPGKIATRELGIVRHRLGVPRERCVVQTVEGAVSAGNVVLIELADDACTEIVTGFGQRGVTAEAVAAGACDEAEAFLQAGVPVGRHLADQILIPMALAGGGEFRTLEPTAHMRTNIGVIRQFLDVAITVTPEGGPVHHVTVRG